MNIILEFLMKLRFLDMIFQNQNWIISLFLMKWRNLTDNYKTFWSPDFDSNEYEYNETEIDNSKIDMNNGLEWNQFQENTLFNLH
jgi:hypothetical protein